MHDVLAIGSDIVECLRIAQMIERHGDLFLNRVFTGAEIQYCQLRAASTQHFARTWAAKEATLQALGTHWQRGIGWRDIEVRVDAEGRARLVLHGAAKSLADRQGVERLHVSLAHCRTHATAYVVACGRRGEDASNDG